MAELIDAHPTPEFPDRPDHEDFRLLSEIVQLADQAAEAGTPVFDIVKVDEASVTYTIEQRIMRTEQAIGRVSRGIASLLGSMWLDGFNAGIEFNQRRTSGTETGTAGEGSSS